MEWEIDASYSSTQRKREQLRRLFRRNSCSKFGLCSSQLRLLIPNLRELLLICLGGFSGRLPSKKELLGNLPHRRVPILCGISPNVEFAQRLITFWGVSPILEELLVRSARQAEECRTDRREAQQKNRTSLQAARRADGMALEKALSNAVAGLKATHQDAGARPTSSPRRTKP